MKTIDKAFFEHIFTADTVDASLAELFEQYGPCLRSEYTLEKEKLVDLDWEEIGLVVTLSHKKLSQVYVSLHDDAAQKFEGWLGLEVLESSVQSDACFDLEARYEYFKLSYNFNEDKTLQSVTFFKK